MMGFGIPELLIILAIVLLVFGPKRLKNIGADLGNAIKGFRTAVSDNDQPASSSTAERVISSDSDGASADSTAQAPANEKAKK